ncbi:MAG: ADP-ribosylglycohydrolase family protein [Candidatus Thorarchaeota archaeon]|jgi:ADP-ribosylglycohydrolase
MEYEKKIRGMFLGVAIGDALGMPVETFTAERIKEVYGRVTEYHRPDNHKWFDGHESGTTTDDTQLTIAVAEGLIESKQSGIPHNEYMDIVAAKHVDAFNEGTHGWGNSTRESIRSICNGTKWRDARGGKGLGNGIAMKISPMSALFFTLHPDQDEEQEDILNMSIDLSFSHGTRIAAASGLVQMISVWQCFQNPFKGQDFVESFLNSIYVAACKSNYFDGVPEDEHKLSDRYDEFSSIYEKITDLKDEEIIEMFGGGTCYCYNSLPFTHAFFLRNPDSIESLYDCVSAGGDTDTNGSMLASMLGARHGEDIFPDHLIEGLKDKDKVLDLADRFCKTFPMPEGLN